MNGITFNIDKVSIIQNSSLELFMCQFQISCEKLLCIVNGTSIRYYDVNDILPKNIRFDYKLRRCKLTEYYFKDINDGTRYCVFGRVAAKIFYPYIDEADQIAYQPNKLNIMDNVKTLNNFNQQVKHDIISVIHDNRQKTILKKMIPSDFSINQHSSHSLNSNDKSHCSESETDEDDDIYDRLIIFDGDQKLIFPNNNYPVEIIICQ